MKETHKKGLTFEIDRRMYKRLEKFAKVRGVTPGDVLADEIKKAVAELEPLTKGGKSE